MTGQPSARMQTSRIYIATPAKPVSTLMRQAIVQLSRCRDKAALAADLDTPNSWQDLARAVSEQADHERANQDCLLVKAASARRY